MTSMTRLTPDLTTPPLPLVGGFTRRPTRRIGLPVARRSVSLALFGAEPEPRSDCVNGEALTYRPQLTPSLPPPSSLLPPPSCPARTSRGGWPTWPTQTVHRSAFRSNGLCSHRTAPPVVSACSASASAAALAGSRVGYSCLSPLAGRIA